jgi:HEAT repeat protein
MTPPASSTPDPMPADQAAMLTEFARAAKGAARTVAIYPATHPSIQGALGRIVAASNRMTSAGDVTLLIHPGAIVIDGRAPQKPDQAIVELADLMHDRLVGSLRVERGADAADWHAFLLLLARAAEDLIAQGGINKAWSLSGRTHFEIREIDYAEVLRERRAGNVAEWDRIIENCLRGESMDLDEDAIQGLMAMVGDPEQFGDFLARLQESDAGAGRMGARAAALLKIVRALMDAMSKRAPDDIDRMLKTVADASARLNPEMMLAMLSSTEERPEGAKGPTVVGEIVGRMTDRTIANFVAGNIVAERGATGRLAQAFEALVPDGERKERVLGFAREEVAKSELADESGFEELWQNASGMLMEYSDKPFVSAEYARELSGARTQAIEVERVADDPPERVQAWLESVSDSALRTLDQQLLLDLLHLEQDPGTWRAIANVVLTEIERLTLLGEARDAQQLLDPISREAGPEGRPAFKPTATAAIEKLAAGPLIRHIVANLRKVEERDVEPFNRLCQTLGPIVIRPLAEALVGEEQNKALRRLREVLLAFGAAGRQSVEQLKASANPAVRRTAIDLLRVFGGREALPELASMLDDADPQVQREAIRAIVQIGTDEAYAVLERALTGGDARARATILQQLIALRDEKAAPLLCYVLSHTSPRGRLVEAHLAIIDSLGGLTAQEISTQTLKQVLYGGDWWAPFRTSALRKAAAIALRRLGTPEALGILEEALATGSRRIRNAARAQIGMARAAATRERAKTTS